MRGLQLGPKQVETVGRLLEAGAALLAEVGYEALTVRQVAVRAGVSPATAYTYVASKNHLIAELFLRHLLEHTATDPVGDNPLDRTRSVTRALVDSLAAAPRLAEGATAALLGTDDDVARLRVVIGAEIVRRFVSAVGPHAEPAVVDALVLSFTGALLQVGMGVMTYPAMGVQMDAVVAVILEGNA